MARVGILRDSDGRGICEHDADVCLRKATDCDESEGEYNSAQLWHKKSQNSLSQFTRRESGRDRDPVKTAQWLSAWGMLGNGNNSAGGNHD